MAVTVTNRGLFLIGSTDIGAADLRMAVFTGNVPGAGAVKDWDSLADVIASPLDEATVGGYSRMDLAGVDYVQDDANNRATLSADAPFQTAIQAGETFTAVAYYVEGATDETRELLAIDEPDTPLVTNGSDVTYPELTIHVTNP